MEKSSLTLSSLNKTWIFDIDGTLCKHNGYKIDGIDTILPGVEAFFQNNVKDEDFVLLLTSRKKEYKEITEKFLEKHNLRYNQIIFDLPFGERIIFNDNKESGLIMAYSVNFPRNYGLNVDISIDKNK